jgi:hypothetical protein
MSKLRWNLQVHFPTIFPYFSFFFIAVVIVIIVEVFFL